LPRSRRRGIEWLTGFDDAQLANHLAAGTTFQDFFDQAHLNPGASHITGVICGVRVEDIEDPLMRRVRYLDKLVDELAKGRPMEKVLRALTPMRRNLHPLRTRRSVVDRREPAAVV